MIFHNAHTNIGGVCVRGKLSRFARSIPELEKVLRTQRDSPRANNQIFPLFFVQIGMERHLKEDRAFSAPCGGHTTSAPFGGHTTSAPCGGHTTSAPCGGHTTSAPCGGHTTSAPCGGVVRPSHQTMDPPTVPRSDLRTLQVFDGDDNVVSSSRVRRRRWNVEYNRDFWQIRPVLFRRVPIAGSVTQKPFGHWSLALGNLVWCQCH